MSEDWLAELQHLIYAERAEHDRLAMAREALFRGGLSDDEFTAGLDRSSAAHVRLAAARTAVDRLLISLARAGVR